MNLSFCHTLRVGLMMVFSTDVEKTQGEEAQKSVAPPPTAQTVWTSGAPDGAICTLWQYN